jgi:hypothetical protein
VPDIPCQTFPYEKPDRHHLPDDCRASWTCGGKYGKYEKVSEMKKTLTMGIILTLFSTPAFAQSDGGDMFTSFIPLILIQLIFMGAFWRFAARVEMRRWVYVVCSFIPLIGSLLYLYLFTKGIILILNKLDNLQKSIDDKVK